MPCPCNENKNEPAKQETFSVSLPSGETKTVNSEHEAKVAITLAGGGTYRRV